MTGTSLAGRRAFVTGAGAGMGRAICLKFAAEGAAVAAVDVDRHALAETAALLQRSGAAVVAQCADIRDRDAVAAAVAAAIAGLGGLDALVNNAGVHAPTTSFLDMTDETWHHVLGVNLQGTYEVTRAVLPALVAAGGGTIVNVVSVAAHVVGGGGVAYTTSKHALLGFTKHLAFDCAGWGVRVNAVCPGAINTNMTLPIWREHPDALEKYAGVPAGRIGEPGEVANLVAYLSGAESTFMHGSAVAIDGGLMLT